MQNDVTLLDRAEADFELAKFTLEKCEQNAVLLDIVAYHVQQGIEKCIKLKIQLAGGKFPRTHDIAKLVNSLDLLNEDVPNWIIENQAVLNSYATNTRYSSSTVGTIRKVKELLELGIDFAQSLREMEKTKDDFSASNIFSKVPQDVNADGS